MFQRLVTKFGLAAHIAILAALPPVLQPFLAPDDLGVVMLWLSAFAVLWFLLSPSILPGEGLTLARRRTLVAFLRDPVTWFFALALVYSLVVWFNSGIELYYDAENAKWLVKRPPFPNMPASAAGSGFLPFCTTLAVAICVQSVRLGLGRQARTWCALATALLTGFGGAAAAIMSFQGLEPFKGACLKNIGEAPFAGSMYIAWLFVAIAAGAQAEAENWGKARLPLALALGGCFCGVVYLLPPAEAAVVLGVAALFLIWALAYAVRKGKGGAAAKMFVMVVFGALFAVFAAMLFATGEIRSAKADQLSFKPRQVQSDDDGAMDGAEEGESTDSAAENTLSRLAGVMWKNAPWSGAGIGAYNVNVPFLAENSDWANLPPKIDWLDNSYWGILAERGIVGCAILFTGLGFLVVYWGIGAVRAFLAVRESEDHDVYVFAVPPVSWCVLFLMPVVAADACFSGVLRYDVAAFSWAIPMALAAASFPRKKQPAK